MLNRRQIRIRALQAIYAFKRIDKANQDQARDEISETFEPDLNSMEVQNKELLNIQKQAALDFFQAKVSKKTAVTSDDEKVVQTATKAYDFYHAKIDKERNLVVAKTIEEADAVHDTYLAILKLFVEIAEKFRNEEKMNGRTILANNPILKDLRHNATFEHLCLKRNISWNKEDVFLSKLYQEAFKKNDRFDEYINEINHTEEAHLAILKYLLKNVIFKHEVSQEYFEGRSLYWADDIETLRAMCAHTFERIVKKKNDAIETLDDQWYEVRDFMVDLVKKVIDQDEHLNTLISPKLKNWDLERINETDEIMVKLGLIEMMNYPSIPVKVTINEAIEIAKDFNTSKSGIFVNGILDSLSRELISDGRIKKSGRGLIDNK